MRRRTELTAAAPAVGDQSKKVHQVFLWIISGATEHQIHEAIALEWPAADARPLSVAAMARITEAADFDAKTIRGWCFEAYRDLYRRMIETGDFAGALRAVKEIQTLTTTTNAN